MYKLQSNLLHFCTNVFYRMQNVKRLMYVPLLLSVFFCSHSLSQCYFFFTTSSSLHSFASLCGEQKRNICVYIYEMMKLCVLFVMYISQSSLVPTITIQKANELLLLLLFFCQLLLLACLLVTALVNVSNNVNILVRNLLVCLYLCIHRKMSKKSEREREEKKSISCCQHVEYLVRSLFNSTVLNR